MRTHAVRWIAWVTLLALLGGCGDCGRGAETRGDAGEEAKDAAPPTAILEVEPNNAPQQASPYTQRSTAPGSPLVLPFEGELTSGVDVDYVTIPAATDGAPRTLRLEPLGEGDVALLWGGSGDAVTDRGGPGEPEVIGHVTAAELLVAVRAGEGGGVAPLKYRLTLERRAPQAGVAVEAGPGEEAATRFKGPGEAQGVVQFRGDVDRFAVDVSAMAGEGARIELRAPPGLTVEASLALDGAEVGSLRAVGEEVVEQEPGEPVKVPEPSKTDGGAAPRRERPADVAVFPNLLIVDGAKELTVEVRASGEAPGWREGYTVRVLPMPPAPKGTAWELEGGEVQGLREPGAVSGFLHAPDDEDAFNLTIPEVKEGEAPYVLTAALSGEAVDWALRVTVPGGEMPERIVMVDAAAGAEEVLCRRVVGAGPVRVEVAAREGAEVGGPYRLEVRWRQASGEELEPNGGLKEASALALGAGVRGVAFPAGDTDVYAFEVAEEEEREGGAVEAEPKKGAVEIKKRTLEREPSPGGGLSKVLPRIGDGPPTGDRDKDPDRGDSARRGVSIELRAVGEAVNPVLVVLDPDGVELARSDRRGLGEEEVIRLDELWAGRYYVRVEMGRGTEASCGAVYTLKARVVGR